MNQQYAWFLENLNIFLLVLIRVTGLFVIAPIFGRRNMPAYFKIGFSFFVALIMMNALSANTLPQTVTLWGYVLTIVKEFLVGVSIGYVGFVVFTAIYVAGQFIDTQIGFSIVSTMDPASNVQMPISANFYYTITMLIFLLINGHHLLIRALFESYKMVPLGAAVFNNRMMEDVFRIFGNIFVIGFKISLPIVAAVFIMDFALGILTKTIPQLNIFVVGMPLKLALGFVLMIITLPAFGYIVEGLIKTIDSEMFQVLKHMGNRP